MPLILSNNEEALELRERWIRERRRWRLDHDVMPNVTTWQVIPSAKFARHITDNVRALAAFQTELEDVWALLDDDAATSSLDETITTATRNPVETARIKLLRRYVQNLMQWRTVATRAQRQWHFAEDYGSGSKEPYFEPPKDGWQERNDIEWALNELDSCTNRLPLRWGRGIYGQEKEVVDEVELLFDEGAAENPSDVAQGLSNDSESDDDFVLTINGQPSGYRMGDVFPGGEFEEEGHQSNEETLNRMPPEWHAIAWLPPDEVPTREQLDAAVTAMVEAETINNYGIESGDDVLDTDIDSDGLFDLMARNSVELSTEVIDPVHDIYATMETSIGVIDEWDAVNRETTGDFADGRFVM